VTRTALVTGGGGFVGQWLIRALLAEGWSVTSAGLAMPQEPALLAPAELAGVSWRRVDVRSATDIERMLERGTPDAVFHLAGVSYVPEAQRSPAETYEVNVLGTVRLLAAIARQRREGRADPVVLVIGSGTQYGRHASEELPLAESAKQWPQDVYAASKAAQEIAALQSFRADGVRVMCTRSFNHSGIGHAEHFLLPALVRRALTLARERPEMRMGNLDSVRDYLHVHDVVRAYLLLVERGTPGEVYNVASGVGVSVRDLVSDVLLRVGRTAEITTDPTLVRSADIPALIGSPAKLERATGWRPVRTRADIIDDLIHAATH
jgi:GDP-4-dehydro-6-deoxy-D-mannose reductase